MSTDIKEIKLEANNEKKKMLEVTIYFGGEAKKEKSCAEIKGRSMNELKRNESMRQTTRQLHFSFIFPFFFVFCTVSRVSLFFFAFLLFLFFIHSFPYHLPSL
jgi:hypothetical protein